MKITDQFYSILSDHELQRRIASLGKIAVAVNNIGTIEALKELLAKLERVVR